MLAVRIYVSVFINIEPMIAKIKPQEQTPKEVKLQDLRKQHVRVGIYSYKQIGYVEWIDYFNKPYVISSKNNQIQTPDLTKKPTKSSIVPKSQATPAPAVQKAAEGVTKPQEISKCLQSQAPKPGHPNPKSKSELNNSCTDSDLSFDISKKKEGNYNRYKNDLVEEPSATENPQKSIDITETPEPISKYDCTPEKPVQQDFDQIFLYNSAVKNLMEEYQEDHESDSWVLELKDPKNYTQECHLQIDNDVEGRGKQGVRINTGD